LEWPWPPTAPLVVKRLAPTGRNNFSKIEVRKHKIFVKKENKKEKIKIRL